MKAFIVTFQIPIRAVSDTPSHAIIEAEYHLKEWIAEALEVCTDITIKADTDCPYDPETE